MKEIYEFDVTLKKRITVVATSKESAIAQINRLDDRGFNGFGEVNEWFATQLVNVRTPKDVDELEDSADLYAD